MPPAVPDPDGPAGAMGAVDPVLGRAVVVTGAGHGIGRAIAGRLAAQGGRLVVNDRDAEACALVAEELGALGIAGDAATPSGVAALVEGARAALGSVDVYVANAGIDRGVGLQASEEDWHAALEVNLMAHVRAARLLVPAWASAGGGRLVVTASAAGLLTMLGSPTYSVSKHAAVAFAEWLSATYRHRGVKVHALCPQGVRTRMLEQAGPYGDLLRRDPVLEPQQVADALWEAMVEDRFLVLPHPEVAQYYAFRATRTDRWLATMNGLQQQVEQAPRARTEEAPARPGTQEGPSS